MPHVRRQQLTVVQKADLWARWKQGESQSEIARSLDRVPGAVFHILVARGGIAPTARSRAERVLSRLEREEISRGLAAGDSYAAIGAHLTRHTSTISREVRRNGSRHAYRADDADRRAWRQ